MVIQSLSTVDTVYSADAIEFSPFNSLLFACGTYQIEKENVDAELDVSKLAIDDDKDLNDNDQDEDEEEEEEEIVSAVPIVTRYGRCLMYKIDTDGTNM